MSILNVNKINPVGGGSTVTIAGIASVTSSVTAPSFVGAVTGDVTGNVTGNVTGTSSGLSGNPSINTTGIITATNVSVGSSVTATSFFGSGAGLTNVSAGKVVGLSIVNSTTNEQNTSGNQTWTLVGPQVTYTAASASNKLVFLHNHHMMTEDLTWSMGLYRDGTGGTLLYRMETYNQSGIWMATQGIGNVVVDAPDTSSHTYQFAIWRNGGSDGKIRYSPNSNSTGSQITVLEIQP